MPSAMPHQEKVAADEELKKETYIERLDPLLLNIYNLVSVLSVSPSQQFITYNHQLNICVRSNDNRIGVDNDLQRMNAPAILFAYHKVLDLPRLGTIAPSRLAYTSFAAGNPDTRCILFFLACKNSQKHVATGTPQWNCHLWLLVLCVVPGKFTYIYGSAAPQPRYNAELYA